MAPPSVDSSSSSLVDEFEPWRASSRTRVQFKDKELVKEEPKVDDVASRKTSQRTAPATVMPIPRRNLTSRRQSITARKRIASKTMKSAPRALSFRDPEINWTVADFFWQLGPRSYLTYHVVSTPFYMIGPVGAAAGVVGHGILLLRQKSSNSSLSSMSSSSFLRAATNGCVVGGVGGALLGLAGLLVSSLRGSKAKPIPWDEDGIHARVLKLSRCVSIRVWDKAVWTCVFWTTLVSLGATALATNRTKDGSWRDALLRPLMQGLSLGSCAGGLLGFFHLSRLATLDEEC